ncbi:uncharacterized protein J4E78_006739 [Alternaria triticimaculans]|uniref:uncharacterized protein n=1 Tax=Alternaria triticimaculans TaxID=297637 RepID=UPI0020C1E20D|nr:uncharacterized protein J4E78_006739 [Alternaria triticimaculans]KAI4656848.1 hypothetical protein J4E78_006739 [Alternaria triticimaculans]
MLAEEVSIEARGRVNTSTGRGKREAEAEAEVEALEARGRFGSKSEPAIGSPASGSTGTRRDAEPIKFSSCGGHRRDADADTGDVATSNEGLTKRGKLVLWDPTDNLVERERGSRWGGSKRGLISARGDSYRREAEPARWGGTSRREAEPIKIPVGSGCRRDDLIERDLGLIKHPGGSPKRDLIPSYSGSYRREAEPIRISSSRGGHRREAEPIAQSMENPGGGPKRRDAAAQPGRLDIGKGHDRRDADAEASNDVVARGKGVPWTPKRDAEAIKINSPGGHRREAEPIKRALRSPVGGSDTDGLAISDAALAERGHNVPWGGKRAPEPADDLAVRDRGSRWGGSKRGLIKHPGGSPNRDLTPGRGGYPRDAAPLRVALGGCRRDAAAQPGRIGTGITCGRRDAAAETIEARQRMSSGTGRGRRRDAIPRDLRGNDANPRGVRPGNGNNERDITAATVEARGRFRGNSRLV